MKEIWLKFSPSRFLFFCGNFCSFERFSCKSATTSDNGQYWPQQSQQNEVTANNHFGTSPYLVSGIETLDIFAGELNGITLKQLLQNRSILKFEMLY